jgi:hypothetical protein
MPESELVPTLMLFTLIAALLIGVVLLLRFRRKRGNRHPMAGQQERNVGQAIDEHQRPPH